MSNIILRQSITSLLREYIVTKFPNFLYILPTVSSPKHNRLIFCEPTLGAKDVD